MLAILYLFLSIYLGDIACRRFLPFLSVPHRSAVALLSGLLISAWWTYLWSVVFSGTGTGLLYGNICFFVAALATVTWHLRRSVAPVDYERDRAPGSDKWDRALIAVFFAVTTFFAFATLKSGENSILPTSRHWSDFGPNVGLIQTFVYGNNFPADNPHFGGELIRHHFLFWFQAANLDYLGLDSAWSINIQSILTIVSMLVLVMVLGEVLFASRVVGRIASTLFFFTGSLAYTTFFRSKETWMEALGEIPGLRIFVQSGYPYAGEAWAIWTVDVFLQQRHFASGIGIFLIALIFIAGRQRKWAAAQEQRRKAATALAEKSERSRESRQVYSGGDPFRVPEFPEVADYMDPPDPSRDPDVSNEPDFSLKAQFPDEPDLRFTDEMPEEPEFIWNEDVTCELDLSTLPDAEHGERSGPDVAAPFETEPQPATVAADAEPPAEIHYENYTRGYVFAGILVGLLPHWHSAVFLSAGVIFAFWLLFYPRRLQMMYFAVAAGITALPQLLFIRAGGMVGSDFPQYKFGYVVLDPTVLRVMEFLGFSLGFKWIFIALALMLAGWFHKRLFLAISSILAITFFVQISPEIVAGHKFINIWLVVANVFVAYGIWRLWHLRILRQAIFSRIITVVLVLGIIIGGVLDIFPIWNEGRVTALYKDDPLVEWIRANTEPDSVFLSAKYVSHPILMAGRRFYLGYTLYAWSAGLNLKDREMHYKRAFEERSPRSLAQLLVEQGIDYVAIDNEMRTQKKQFYGFNEAIYKKYFEVVYDDAEKRYGLITIYKVPADPSTLPEHDIIATPPDIDDSPAATAFEGGVGKRPGQFINPRGIGSDKAGSIYIADSGNARIQKFGPDGKFVSVFGTPGPAEGELVEPNGVTINSAGDILVVDVGRHRLLVFDPAGAFDKESMGTTTRSFFGPRDVAIGLADQVYVLDQGNSRVVRLDARLAVVGEWGSQGTGEGQFREPTGIEIGGQRVFVTDNLNNRVQVFDLEGKFLAAWPVPEWNGFPWHFPDMAYDPADGRLYVTDPIAKQVLVFDSSGNRAAPLPAPAEGTLESPSYLTISVEGGRRRLLVVNTSSSNLVKYDLGAAKPK